MDEKLKAAILAFEDFLNEPPQYEDKRMVREYRHEAYRKWSELRDQITAALPAQEWQDISTAPKDGTEILAISSMMNCWIVLRDGKEWTDTWSRKPLGNLTHWMPLPAPTVAVIAEERGT